MTVFGLDAEAQDAAALEFRRLLAARAPVALRPKFEHPVADLWLTVAWLIAFIVASAYWPAAETWTGKGDARRAGVTEGVARWLEKLAAEIRNRGSR